MLGGVNYAGRAASAAEEAAVAETRALCYAAAYNKTNSKFAFCLVSFEIRIDTREERSANWNENPSVGTCVTSRCGSPR